MPDFGMWDPIGGDWVVENHGVDPDIEVENPPHELVSGRDPQLERAIQYIQESCGRIPRNTRCGRKYRSGTKAQGRARGMSARIVSITESFPAK
jgi:C-terminal processing protease CtpA/Prc